MSTTSIDPDDQYTARDNAQRSAALIDRDIKLSIALEALRKLVPRIEEYAQNAGPCDHDVGICVCEIVREAEQGALALRKLQESEDGRSRLPKTTYEDNVNHPTHYTSHPSGIECIQITEHFNFNIGNAIKYLWRAGFKSTSSKLEDLRKAAWYVNREIERITNLTK